MSDALTALGPDGVRAVAWGAAVHALAAAGWLPDEPRALRAATHPAGHGLARVLADAGRADLAHCWPVPNGQTVADALADAGTAALAGAQLALCAWWDGAHDARPLLRLLAHADRRVTVVAACACARTTLHHVPAGEDRPRRAIEAAEAWARGELDVATVRSAAADAAAAASAYGAAYAASVAATCADAAAPYAAAAADAAAAAAADAAAAAYWPAYRAALARLADVVRAHAVCPAIETLLGERS